nr:tetratricopeptide repeat protein [Acidimicrobiia bacterium]
DDARAERLSAYLSRLQDAAPAFQAELARSRQTFQDLLDGTTSSDDGLDPRTRFENMVLAVEGLVGALEAGQPVIVSIADAQWLDPSTAEVLERLRVDLAETPVAILLESRPDESPLVPDHEIALSPLDRSAIARLATAALDAAPSQELVDLLVDRSGGNPFFVEQLLDYLGSEARLETGTDGVTAELVEHQLPEDMQRLLVARLDELEVPVRRTVQTASVLGREFDRRVLASIVGDPTTVNHHIDAAIDARIWEVDDEHTVGFRQSLLREAAYAMQLHTELAGLHASAATAIEKVFGAGAAFAGELAYHLDAAGDPAAAVPHYLAAGREAAERYANAEAVGALRRLLEVADPSDLDTRFDALMALHGVHSVLGDRDGQSTVLEALDQITEARSDRALEVARLRAELMSAIGDYAGAQQLGITALESSDAAASAHVRGALLFLLAQASRYQGRPAEAADRAAEAAAVFEAADDPVGVATVDDFLGGIAWELGDFAEAERRHRRAADAFRRAGHVIGEIRALNNLGSALFGYGDYSAARHIHEVGAEQSRTIGYRMGEGDHLDNVGGTAWAVGDFDLAVEQYSAALEIRELTDDAWGIAISKGNLGSTYRAKGDLARAIEFGEAALIIDRRIGRRRGEAYDLHGLGLCYLELGEHDRAVDHLDAAAAIRSDLGEQHLANESVVAAAVARLRRGERRNAADIVEAALADEAGDLFAGAVETTATLLRCIEVLESVDPDAAEHLRNQTASLVAERASRIGDPGQRASYLAEVASHRGIATDDPLSDSSTPGD